MNIDRVILLTSENINIKKLHWISWIDKYKDDDDNINELQRLIQVLFFFINVET